MYPVKPKKSILKKHSTFTLNTTNPSIPQIVLQEMEIVEFVGVNKDEVNMQFKNK